jgi:hypothetical protein
MRQLPAVLLCLGALGGFAQTPANSIETNANPRVEKARKALANVSELVAMGALPRQRIEQAQLDLADAQDEAILAHSLYGEVPVKDLTSELAGEMVAAAERRVDRQRERLAEAEQLVSSGLAAQSSLTPVQMELNFRQSSLDLARSRARLMDDMADLARLEESIAAARDAASTEDAADLVTEGMEHFEGKGVFVESRDLKPIEAAFAKKFEHALPISAEGQTALHRALGYDHRGRVDVALDPNSAEGMWLRGYLKSSEIPYYAFTHAVPGKATAAHIHIGPGSTRWNGAD